MKIPETSANVGAYYGNEENGQWQPNGVIIESVGGGDATLHRPPVYPVHIPRGHIPMEAAGYIMPGGYYGPPTAYPPAPPDDFADYMWMEHEEEFDKQVMQQLEEEALMEQCIEAMLEDEQRERQRPVANGHGHFPTTSATTSVSLEEAVSRSTLNPLAAEFVPTRARLAQTEERKEPIEAPVATIEEIKELKSAEEEKPVHKESVQKEMEQAESNNDDPVSSPTSETPEVSAADIQPLTQDKRPKEIKKDMKPKVETKKPVKQEIKPKVKPTIVKSETKVPPKKKEVKVVKSETKAEENIEKEEEEKMEAPLQEVPKNSPSPTEETKEPSQPEFKPINYAAAAKASKPKPKPTTPPISEKTPPPGKTAPPPPKTEKKIEPKLSKPVEKKDAEKKEKVPIKDKVKSDKAVIKTEKPIIQRKNSAK